jgi:iron complex transport system substrate-binding protein
MSWRACVGIIIACGLIAGCGNGNGNQSSASDVKTGNEAVAESETAFPVTVQGADGDVVIANEPQRIVALYYEDNVVQLGGHLVGAATIADDSDGYFDHLGEAVKSAEQVGAYPYNVEKIISLNPDLVIIAGKTLDDEQYSSLSQLTTVLQIDYTTMTWEEVHLLIGKALGKEEKAREFIEDYVRQEQELQQIIKAEMSGKEVAYVTPNQDGTFWLWGRTDKGDVGPILYEKFGFTPASNLPDEGTGISLEGLAELDPEVLLISESYFEESFKETNTWKSLKSVKNGQVYEIDKDFRIKAYYPLGMLSNLENIRDLFGETNS